MTTLEEWRQVALSSIGLPDDKLLGVLKLVEQVPDRSHVREVLDRIRPRLVQLRPPRPLTAQRVMFRPVEDLFDPPERYRAKLGRLSRLTVQPCWTVIANLADQKFLHKVNEAVRVIPPNNANDIYAAGLTLWQAGAKALASFLAEATSVGKHKVGKEFVSLTEDLRQQLVDIADILDIAAEIETVKLQLPERPIKVLSQADVELLGSVLGKLGCQSIRKVQTFILVFLARMNQPGDLFRVLSDVSLPCTTNERTGMLRVVGTNALATLSSEAQDLRKLQTQSADPSEGAKTAENLVARLNSLERTLSTFRDPKVADQIQATRKEIGSYVVDKLLVKTDQTLFENLKPPPELVAKTGTSEPTIEQVETAEKCALSLRRCAKIADSAGVRKEVDKKLNSICSELESQVAAKDANPTVQERKLMRSVRLIEMIAGPDEAQRVLMTQFTL